MQQQGTSTPTGVTASDPSPQQAAEQTPDSQPLDPQAARQIGHAIAANIPGGGDAQQQLPVNHPKSAGRPEGIVSDPD